MADIDAAHGASVDGEFVFYPQSVHSAASLDQAMRTSLAESLAHIHGVGQAFLEAGDRETVYVSIRQRRQPPGLFARYYDLVVAMRDGNRAEAAALFHEIADLAEHEFRFAVVPLSARSLGTDAARYARLLGAGRGDRPALMAPEDEQWAGFDGRIAAALAELDRVDAALAGEVRGLVMQVVGTVPADDGRTFGSASSLMMWGAVAMNLRKLSTRLELIDGLVHEAAHQFLFGLSIEEPLVRNPIEARYRSPLRPEPRPMDGVYHATFVCARLHYLYQRLADAGSDGPEASALIEENRRAMRQAFDAGLATVSEFAELTDCGRDIMIATADYMSSAA